MRPGGGGEAGSEGRGTGDDPAPYAVVGTILDGRFRAEGVLGSGGMATVFRARDLHRGGETVALKLLRPEFSGEPEAVERLRREAAVLERLRHPAIVGFEAQGLLPDGRLYLAMELLEGETLGDRLRRSRRLDVGELVPVLDGVAGALTAAHEAGVIHRDLKPDNIFLLDALPGDARGVKLLDFGISKVYGSASLTRTGQIVGTPRYMAPEQLLGEADLDRRVDVYALGVILYECLTGVPPYVGQVPADLVVAVLDGRAAPLTAVRPELPAEVGAVVMRALSRQRDGRQGTARALLQGFLRAAGLPPRPPAAQAPAAEGPGGRPLRTAALGEMSGPTEPSEERVSGAALVPGTFQALPAVAPRAGAPLPAGDPVPHASTPEPRTPLRPSGAASSSGAGSFSAAGSSSGAAGAPVGVPSTSGPSSSSSESSVALPVRRPSWVLLAVGGVVLGALTTVVAVALVGGGADPAGPPATGIIASPGSTTGGAAPEAAAGPATGAFDAATSAPEGRARREGGSPGRGEAGFPSAGSEPAAAGELDGRSGVTPGSAASARDGARRSRASSPGASHEASAADGDARRARRASAASSRRRTASGRGAAAPAPRGPGGGGGPPTALGAAPGPASAGDDGWTPVPPAPAAATADPPSTSDLLRQARAALRAGSPDECLRLVDRAQRAGAPPLSLRLEGDCLLQAGRAGEARKTYERFCQRLPGHPSIPELRRTVERLGGRCP